jgi:RNA polymerase sigma-70 factor, ECF subfamily
MTENEKNMENINDDYEHERVLIRQVKLGYAPAFTQLVTLYQKQVFRLAYGFFQDKDDAMEIVQDTFLRVYQKLSGFDENDQNTRLGGWINRIAYNLCIDYYRKFKKKKAEMKDIYQFEEENRTVSHFPEDHLDRQNFQHLIKKSVQTLPAKQKMIFVLKHYSGYKHHEISTMLNVSVGTSKSLYFRAVQTLKKSLVQTDEFSTMSMRQRG